MWRGRIVPPRRRDCQASVKLVQVATASISRGLTIKRAGSRSSLAGVVDIAFFQASGLASRQIGFRLDEPFVPPLVRPFGPPARTVRLNMDWISRSEYTSTQ